MGAGNLLFFEVTFQKGRRREGGEDSVNQRIATMMVMVAIVTAAGVHGDSQGSFPSITTQQSRMPPQGRIGQCGFCCFTEGKCKASEWREPCSSLMSAHCHCWARLRPPGSQPYMGCPHGLQLWSARENGAFVGAKAQAHAFCSLGWRSKEMVWTGG